MKRIALLAVLAFGLTGCGGEGWTNGIYEFVTPDGQSVWCATTSGGGVDCDWERAARR